MPFLVHLCAPCNITSIKMMPCSGREHPQLYCVKIWSQSNQRCQSYWWFCTPPVAVAVQTRCQNVIPLPICLLHQICHPWPTKHQFLYHSLHTTGLSVTRCDEFCLFKCQFETWTSICIRSRLRKNLIICSASWAKRAMPPWTDGYQQMKHTRMTPRSS